MIGIVVRFVGFFGGVGCGFIGKVDIFLGIDFSLMGIKFCKLS